MEVVVFLAMMIVPFISIAALIVAMMAKKQSKNVKDYLLRSVRSKGATNIEEFTVSEL